MLKAVIVLSVLVAVWRPAFAFALGAEDTMVEWGAASEATREGVLDAIGPGLAKSYRSERSDLLLCVDRAGAERSHATLQIREVVEACAAILEQADPEGEAPEEHPI